MRLAVSSSASSRMVENITLITSNNTNTLLYKKVCEPRVLWIHQGNAKRAGIFTISYFNKTGAICAETTTRGWSSLSSNKEWSVLSLQRRGKLQGKFKTLNFFSTRWSEDCFLSFASQPSGSVGLSAVSFWREALNGSQLLMPFKNSTNSHLQDETSHVALLSIDKSTCIPYFSCKGEEPGERG